MATQSTAESQGKPVQLSAYEEAMENLKSEGLVKTAIRRIRHDPLTLTAIALLVVLSFLSFFAPQITDAVGVSFTDPLADRAFLMMGDTYDYAPDWSEYDSIAVDVMVGSAEDGEVTGSLVLVTGEDEIETRTDPVALVPGEWATFTIELETVADPALIRSYTVEIAGSSDTYDGVVYVDDFKVSGASGIDRIHEFQSSNDDFISTADPSITRFDLTNALVVPLTLESGDAVSVGRTFGENSLEDWSEFQTLSFDVRVLTTEGSILTGSVNVVSGDETATSDVASFIPNEWVTITTDFSDLPDLAAISQYGLTISSEDGDFTGDVQVDNVRLAGGDDERVLHTFTNSINNFAFADDSVEATLSSVSALELPVSLNSNRQSVGLMLEYETQLHPLGTDHLGRDVFARVLYGGRVSLTIGIVAALAATTIGVTLGLLAGYYQGGTLAFIDDFMMWFITTLNSIPLLMLLILMVSVLTPSIQTLIIILSLVSWTGTMRLIRGETLSHRSNEYVLSARAMGAGPLRIMFVHILPNTLSVLITALSLQIGTLILVETALSFLGLGVRPPDPSWGNMLTGAQTWFRQGPHLSILPGMAIVITVLSLYLLGDGLRDAFDPRSTK